MSNVGVEETASGHLPRAERFGGPFPKAPRTIGVTVRKPNCDTEANWNNAKNCPYYEEASGPYKDKGPDEEGQK